MSGDPKRLARRLVIAMNVFAATVMASLFVLGFLSPGEVGVPTAGTYRGETGRAVTLLLFTTEARLAFALGLCVLVGNLLYLLYGRRVRTPLRHVASEGAGGAVMVAREAIEAGLRAAGEALPEVTRMRVSIEQAGLKRIRVKAQFQAPEGVSLHDASRNLRHALEQRFHEMVHLAEGARVDHEIEFVGFAGKAPKKGQGAAPAAQDPFTGPRYPIDDDEPYEGKRSS